MGIERYLKYIDKINHWAGVISSYLVLYIMFTLCYEVICRYIFNSPTIWVYEVNSYVFCFYVALMGGYIMLQKAHINVEIIYEKFSPRRRLLINIITSVCFFIVVLTLLWKSGYMAWESWQAREESFSLFVAPIYPSKIAIPVGAFLLLLQGTANVIRDVIQLAKGDTPSKA